MATTWVARCKLCDWEYEHPDEKKIDAARAHHKSLHDRGLWVPSKKGSL